jgi:hypothetical protein
MKRLITVLSLLVAGGCGGTTDQPPGCTGPDCGTPPVCADPSKLCLPEPEAGIQMRSVGELIAPGEDVEYCEVVVLPGDASTEYYVKRFEVQMTTFSHHLIVSAAVVGSDTEAAAKPGTKKKCIGARTYGGELVPVTGSQQAYNSESYPDGVGRLYHGGQRLIFDYHYLNTSSEPIQAAAAVNFHTVPASQVERIARSFGFYNLSNEIEPDQEADFTKTCTFNHDVMVHKLTRHTHQWGTDFDVHYAGGARDGELIFSSEHYEDIRHVFPEPILMKKDEGFEFRCAFRNTNDYPLTFGLKASDEMCILFGTWFVTNEGDEVPSQGCFGY